MLTNKLLWPQPLLTFCKSKICHTQNLSRPAAIDWSFCKNNEGKNRPLGNFSGLAVIQGRLKTRTAVTPSSIGKWKNPSCCSYKWKTNWPLLLISETNVLSYGAQQKRELTNFVTCCSVLLKVCVVCVQYFRNNADVAHFFLSPYATTTFLRRISQSSRSKDSAKYFNNTGSKT